MKTPLLVFLVLCLITPAHATRYSTEDESRFKSQPYTKAEPDMLTPTAYVERAKSALRIRYHDIRMAAYDTPIVTRRIYADAPAAGPRRDLRHISLQGVDQASTAGVEASSGARLHGATSTARSNSQRPQ